MVTPWRGPGHTKEDVLLPRIVLADAPRKCHPVAESRLGEWRQEAQPAPQLPPHTAETVAGPEAARRSSIIKNVLGDALRKMPKSFDGFP